MVIDDGFHIVEDTYHIDSGKTIVSEDVIRCFQNERTSHYDAENRYIEVTLPIMDSEAKNVQGVVLQHIH